MAARRYPGIPGEKDPKFTLNQMLDFGPEGEASEGASQGTHDLNSRLRNIAKQMQEISRRIDNLNDKY